MSNSPGNSRIDFQEVLSVLIKLLAVGALLITCYHILKPFLGIALWSVILALILAPIYNSLKSRLGISSKWTAIILILIGSLLIITPAFMIFDSLVNELRDVIKAVKEGTNVIPPPPAKVESWPLIGEKLFEAWNEASSNFNQFAVDHQEDLSVYLKKFVGFLAGLVGMVATQVISVIIACTLLAVSGTRDLASKILNRLLGDKSEEYIDLISSTVLNVTKGVLGVALIQAILFAIGLFWAGVPYAGLWTLLVLILAILQIPVVIVTIPVIIWLFGHAGTTAAIVWSIYFFIAGLADNVLKPILLGRGSAVPMIVIFLGVIGGFLYSGFMGLFTGAIIVSITYLLAKTWLEDNMDEPQTQAANSAPAPKEKEA